MFVQYMSIASVPNYGSAANWMKSVVGLPSQQYGDSLVIGQDNNRYWGNNILPVNFNGHTFGGSRRTGGRRGRRGGSLSGALTAAVPAVAMLYAQQNYGKGRNIYSQKRMRKYRKRGTRRYR